MADQKVMKKRLKALMMRPENQICSDCPERQPRWASLIVPPPESPPGTQPIGAFCCLECSGSHRRLGVHIAFVRSINLDSWKENEVRAMENGGNSKVNSIFEARLPSQDLKPTQTANGQTRERYIRDKYERRKYFDPSGYSQDDAPGVVEAPASAPAPQVVGLPSDAAKKRLEQQRARKAKETPPPKATSRTPQLAPAPVSAPVDLLDLFALEDAPSQHTDFGLSHQLDHRQGQQDLGKSLSSLSDFLESDKKSHLSRGVVPEAAKPPAPKQAGVDIMSLYHRAHSAPQSFANFGDANHGMQTPQHQSHQQMNMMGAHHGHHGGGNKQNNMMMMNNHNGGISNGTSGVNSMQHMTQMMQNMQMQPQQQQQQMMMTPQQQQQMYQQMMMIQQQQQQQQMYQQMMMMQQHQAPAAMPTPQSSAKKAAPEKEDPFAHFAGLLNRF